MSIQCKCYGSNEDCRWCFGTGTVHDSKVEQYQGERTWIEKANDAEHRRTDRVAKLPQPLQLERSAAIGLSDLSRRMPESAYSPTGVDKEDVYGPFLPWHLLPPSSTPAVTFEVDSPKLLINELHNAYINREAAEGWFCGSPVYRADMLGMEVDREQELTALCGPARPYMDSYLSPNEPGYGVILFSTHDSVPAEVLPGETICADNIIRRTTTAEHRGDSFYAQLEENIVDGKLVSTEEARQASQQGAMVTWFKDHAIVHEEVACA